MEAIEKFWSVVGTDVIHWSLKVGAALLIFMIGRWIATRLVNALGRIMRRRDADSTVSNFLLGLANAVLLIVVILAALGTLGVPTHSMLAVMGAAGLAIGLALKDSLSNIAAGVLMVAFRPFRVGDFVECASVKGKVEKITVFYTEMRTIDNKLVIIPNSLVTSGVITNFTDDDKRRLEITVGVGYGSDLGQVRALLLETLKQHPRVLTTPPPTVGITNFGDNAIGVVLRPWVHVDDTWDATSEIHEAVKKTLDENGIDIPYPQRVVHLQKPD